MSLSNEDLLALSNLIDTKLDPIKSELQNIRVDLLENNVIPRLNTIENCYLSTYNRYQMNADNMEAMKTDIDIMKKVIINHSERLQRV